MVLVWVTLFFKTICWREIERCSSPITVWTLPDDLWNQNCHFYIEGKNEIIIDMQMARKILLLYILIWLCSVFNAGVKTLYFWFVLSEHSMIKLLLCRCNNIKPAFRCSVFSNPDGILFKFFLKKLFLWKHGKIRISIALMETQTLIFLRKETSKECKFPKVTVTVLFSKVLSNCSKSSTRTFLFCTLRICRHLPQRQNQQ